MLPLLLGIVFVGWVCGCTTTYKAFSGERPMPSELVTIAGSLEDSWAVFRSRTLLVKSLDQFRFGSSPKIETSPGRHSLSVFYLDTIIIPGGQLRCSRLVNFDVELVGGATYQLSYENKDGSLTIWLFNSDTNQRAGEGKTRSCEIF